MDRLTYALRYAEMGIRVFPIIEGTKRPALDDWQNHATTDADMIRKWFGKADHNIGIATGQGIMAIDADTKDGAPGVDSLELLDLEMLPLSFRTRTPSGGTHVLLRTDGEVRNRVKSIDGYPGIDIRGEGGYVLGAGSRTDDGPGCVAGEYTIEHDGAIEPMPEAFKAVLGKRPRHQQKTDEPVTDLDTDTNIRKAIDWLEHHAPRAIEGEGGDDATYRTAAMLRDFGLSEPIALDLMFEHWNERQEPPWQAQELADKVANAFTYASGTWGGKTPQADFDPVDIGENDEAAPPSREAIAAAGAVSAEVQKQSDAKKRRERFQVFSAADSFTTATATAFEPLVENIMNQNTLAVALGAPGAAKTFNLIDMSLCIASGKPWAGKYNTTKGAVFYIATEGGTGIHRRIAAAMIHHDLDPAATPFFVLPASVDFGQSTDDAKAIIKLAREAARRVGIPLRLIVVDTLARAIGGGDENSAQDMSAFVRNMDLLRENTGATVLVVHHTGKDETKGARGSSALNGAIDTEITISSKGHVSTTKQRDLEEIETVATFELRDQDIGLDPNGVMLHSAIVEYGEAAGDFDDLPEDGGAELFLEILLDLSKKAAENGRGGWVTRAECQVAYDRKLAEFRGEDGGKPLSVATAKRWLKALVDGKHVETVQNGKNTRYSALKKSVSR